MIGRNLTDVIGPDALTEDHPMARGDSCGHFDVLESIARLRSGGCPGGIAARRDVRHSAGETADPAGTPLPTRRRTRRLPPRRLRPRHPSHRRRRRHHRPSHRPRRLRHPRWSRRIHCRKDLRTPGEGGTVTVAHPRVRRWTGQWDRGTPVGRCVGRSSSSEIVVVVVEHGTRSYFTEGAFSHSGRSLGKLPRGRVRGLCRHRFAGRLL